MQKLNIENTKQLLIKRLSMLMVACYVLNLFQFQISPVLHSISHILEAPENIISHHSKSSIEYEIHHQGNHDDMQKTHDHEIIDLLDSIIESSKEDNNSDETLPSESKFDKHINVEKYQKKVVFVTKKSKPFLHRHHKLKRGHLEIPQEPPKSFLAKNFA